MTFFIISQSNLSEIMSTSFGNTTDFQNEQQATQYEEPTAIHKTRDHNFECAQINTYPKQSQVRVWANTGNTTSTSTVVFFTLYHETTHKQIALLITQKHT